MVADTIRAVSNPHLEPDPVFAGAPLDRARRAALVVHGRGQTPDYMLAILDRVAVPDIAYVLPRAAGQTWYPAGFMQPLAVNQPWADHALDAMAAFLARIAEAGIGAEDVFLVGFSQGACLLSELLVRSPRRYAGAALLTGGYLGPEERAPAGSLAGTPVFAGTSRYDEWVPLERAESTARLLERMGAAVTLRVYDDREHLVNDDEIAEVRKLLTS